MPEATKERASPHKSRETMRMLRKHIGSDVEVHISSTSGTFPTKGILRDVEDCSHVIIETKAVGNKNLNFVDSTYAIKAIAKPGGDKIYDNPHIEGTYGERTSADANELREKIFGPGTNEYLRRKTVRGASRK